MQVHEIIKCLEETTSTNAKLDILRQNKNNDILKNVFFMALNPNINFYILDDQKWSVNGNFVTFTLETALDKLYAIANRDVTGNVARQHLQNILNHVTGNNEEIIRRIIRRDMRCGVSVETVLKVWPNLIPNEEFMLCSTNMKNAKINDGVFVQLKEDGGRVHITINDGNVSLTTRGNNTVKIDFYLEDQLKELCPEGIIKLDGEVVFFKDDKPLPRKDSNGLFNKAIRGTIRTEELSMMRCILWDVVDTSSTIPYKDRFASLNDLFKDKELSRLSVVHTDYCTSEDQIMTIFQKYVSKGLEGVIVKNLDGLWEPTRSKNCIKIKEQHTADLRIIGYELGTGKYEGMLGALKCESSCGKLFCKVGTGFDDESRVFLKKMIDESAQYIIAEIEYNQKIKSKGDKLHCLFLPVFKNIRLDKKEANSLGEIK